MAIVEGVILVATPALIRDFSPQVGRATAMGFWTIGPVLGSLMVSLLTTLTLPLFGTWQSQFVICGVVCLVVFVLAVLFLRELAPGLRDQVMVNERDRVLIERRAAATAAAARSQSLGAPFARLMRLDVIGSAFGVSVLLLFYYTSVAFGTIYLVTVQHLSVASANAVGNWAWGTNAVALVVAGVASDRLRVRKPFMLAGGIGALVFTVLWLLQASAHPSFATLALLASGQSICVAFAYATCMASFTETVEAHDHAAGAPSPPTPTKPPTMPRRATRSRGWRRCGRRRALSPSACLAAGPIADLIGHRLLVYVMRDARNRERYIPLLGETYWHHELADIQARMRFILGKPAAPKR